jgi:hypothetical protein
MEPLRKLLQWSPPAFVYVGSGTEADKCEVREGKEIALPYR